MIEVDAAASRFRDLLRAELDAAGLILSRSLYEEGREEVSLAGFAERQRLAAAIGPRTWQRAMDSLHVPYPDESCARVLGFGRQLTSFLVAPMRPARQLQEPLGRLGALANLIVSLYDHVIDDGIGEAGLLPQWLLARGALAPARWALAALAALSPPAQRVVLKLVGRYFAELCGLPHAARHDRRARLLRRTILVMYQAENQLAATHRHRGVALHLRRKGALPFVVMGGTAWLAEPAPSRQELLRHLRWLYRCGEFFGWVDDAVDLEADAASGRPNRLQQALAPLAGRLDAERDLARRLAGIGRSLVLQYRPGAERSDGTMQATAFSICLMSWLGLDSSAPAGRRQAGLDLAGGGG